MSSNVRDCIAFGVSAVAPGVPLLFSSHPWRGLVYFLGFWIGLFLFFPLAIYSYIAALAELPDAWD